MYTKAYRKDHTIRKQPIKNLDSFHAKQKS